MGSRFFDLRSVRWRVNLGVLPSSLDSTIDDLRRITADSRRRYATLRKCLLVDPQITRFGNDSPDLVTDNPLSQNPDSTWGRFFRNAELEKMVDKDLSRLYPEHGSYFQTPACQRLLRRILLLWCLKHPECGYRQGMHEVLAPLIYVLHEDIQHLNKVRELYKHHFVDKFDEDSLNENLGFNFDLSPKYPIEDSNVFQEASQKHPSSDNLDANLQDIVLLSDPYGADGELGIVLSEKFTEHDAYSMFDALMSGSGGDVAMAEFFTHVPATATPSGLPPVIEASQSLYHLLSVVDPSLYTHLIELGVEPQYFALRWLRVLFGREFSLDNLLIIWDEIFSYDNNKSVTSESGSGVSNSPRGAFISSMAVSMMLNARSSLLATELATSCLQRLLNFPERVDLDKIIGKAKSLVPLALDANTPSRGRLNHIKQTHVKGRVHSLSFDSSSLNTTPVNVVPESYWEEKWRLLQKSSETKKETSIQQIPLKKRGWTEKFKSKLSRTESDPSQGKRESREQVRKPTVRRSLLEDLARQLNAEDDSEDSRDDKFSFLDDPLHDSEEHSPAFSDPRSPLENNSGKSSSVGSNMSNDAVDDETQESASFPSTSDESPLPISDAPDFIAREVSGGGSDDGSRELSVGLSKNWKIMSGKFQWLWKFGRHNSGAGTSDKIIEAETSDSNLNCDGIRLKTDGCDRNLVFALRNLGQLMLENVQVIESAFQSERKQEGSQEQLSKHALVEKGQMTAMCALKELRKISHLLREA